MSEKQTTVKVGTVPAKDGSIEVVISAPKSPSLLGATAACGAKGVPFSGGTAAAVLGEGALKKDLAEAKDALAATAAAVDTGADDAVSPTPPSLSDYTSVAKNASVDSAAAAAEPELAADTVDSDAAISVFAAHEPSASAVFWVKLARPTNPPTAHTGVTEDDPALEPVIKNDPAAKPVDGSGEPPPSIKEFPAETPAPAGITDWTTPSNPRRNNGRKGEVKYTKVSNKYDPLDDVETNAAAEIDKVEDEKGKKKGAELGKQSSCESVSPEPTPTPFGFGFGFRSGFGFGKLCSSKLLCIVFSIVVLGLGCSAFALSPYGSELLDSVPDAAAIPVFDSSNITPKAREPIFAPSLTPCEAGFVPTCEQAKGFGLCDTTNSACDTTCVDEVKMTCPVTCSLSAEATSGHLDPPSDYGKRLPSAAAEAICSTCADRPDLPCCHNHPHEDGRRHLSELCTDAIISATPTIRNPGISADEIFEQPEATGKCHAIAFSSGDEDAAYQAGVLKGITTNPKLSPSDYAYDSVSGVSGGALNAVLLSSFEKGQEQQAAERMEVFWKWFGGIAKGLFFEGGLYNSAPMEDFLKSQFKGVQMHRNLDIGIVDVINGDYKDFSDLNITHGDNLIDALYASMSFAGFFPPAEVLGSAYFDGSAVWDIVIFSAINRCSDKGFKNEDIVVDVVLTSSANLKQVQAEDYTSVGMLFRYLEILSFYNSMDGLLKAQFAYKGVNFRYVISPSEGIPSSMYPLNLKEKDIDKAFSMGVSDANKAISDGSKTTWNNLVHYYSIKKSGDARILKHTYGSFRDAKENNEFEEYDIMKDDFMRKYTYKLT